MTASLHPTAMGGCVCVPVRAHLCGFQVLLPTSQLAKLGTLKTGNARQQQDERRVLLSCWTGQCYQGTQMLGQFLVNQNRHKDVTGHP